LPTTSEPVYSWIYLLVFTANHRERGQVKIDAILSRDQRVSLQISYGFIKSAQGIRP